MADGEAYGGLLGAIRYSYGHSDSRLFRSFVAVGTVVAAFLAFLFVNGIVTLIAATAAAQGGTLTVVRGFFVVVLLAAVAPIVAPMLAVARRLRREGGCTHATQRALGAAGYLYLAALYVGLVISAPDGTEPTPAGATAPLVAALNALPDTWGYLVPLVAGLGVFAALWYAVVR